MFASTPEEVWGVISKFQGVPRYWADVFASVGLSAEEAGTWVQTAERDRMSVLSALREKELNATLVGYAEARGISLLGAGAGEDPTSKKGEKMVCRVSTVLTVAEQQAVLSEVSAFTDVEFKEKINGVYSQHAVANAVRSVHGSYLRKMTGNCVTLEAGASVKNAVLAGVDPTTHHCCCPVYNVKDSVRQSVGGFLNSVLSDAGKYGDDVRRAAIAAKDEASGFVCRLKPQECTRQVEMVTSNETTHDVAFDDLPLIMARHGAKMWFGFMTRAPGVFSVGGPTHGRSAVLGTRWRLNRQKDEIVFHFDKDSSFSYTHKFSQWVKYEEQFGYRWRGQYFDYVYARLPITTESSLAFVVARVPKTLSVVREPVYKLSSSAGMVRVKSIKAVGTCIGAGKVRFEPCEFVMESVVFDQVLETRLAQGDRGGLASTIAYLRSVRVRLSVNGVFLGTTLRVPQEILESAAVAIEILAADDRMSGNRDYAAIMKAAATVDGMNRVARYFSGVTRFVSAGTSGLLGVVKTALSAVLNSTVPISVSAEPASRFVCVAADDGLGEVTCRPQLADRGCGCSELTSVSAALKMGRALSRTERAVLIEYAARLRETAEACEIHNIDVLGEEVAEEEFVDACEFSSATDVNEGSVGAKSSANSTSTTLTDDTVESDGCFEKGCAADFEPMKSCDEQGGVVSAIAEYARWAAASDRHARSEARVNYENLFLTGTPTKEDIERSTTARTRHAVVPVVNSKLGELVGSFRDDDGFAEVYVPSLRRTARVFKRGDELYISENVTELCYTSTDLAVMNGDELNRAALNVLGALPKAFAFPKFTFVDGVPGCGKTTEIISRMVADVEASRVAVYLTATVASCAFVSKQLAKRFGKNPCVCRTYDSYLINGASELVNTSVDVLYMDEAPMAHKGQLFSCLAKMSPMDANLFGDSHQIPWLPFMPGFSADHAIITDEFTVERRFVSHRFGAKICAMWLDVYGKIFPCNCCNHDDPAPRVVRITSFAGIPENKRGKFLAFTQEEKMTVKREGGFSGSLRQLRELDAGGLSTVGEDQGGTHDSVTLVRLVNKRNPKESRLSPSIYNKQPWVLVGTTRQREELVYYTAAGDDLVTARFDLAVCPVRLHAVTHGIPWEDVEDRAQHVRVFGI